MAKIDLILPKMGESVAEATITKWLKAEGETIDADESVLEIATDKVDSEVPAPESGVLQKILFQEGDVVKVGEVIAIMTTDASEIVGVSPAPPAPVKAPEPVAPAPMAAAKPAAVAAPTGNGSVDSNVAEQIASNGNHTEIARIGGSGRFYSPLVRNIATAEGIGVAELDSIPGTGKNGRVTKKDILAYIPNRTAAPRPQAEIAEPAPSAKIAAKSSTTTSAPTISVSGGDEIIEMDRMRKLIADHMVMSKSVSPHVTSYVEADVTNLVNWRNKVKKEFQDREGEKITFTPLFIEAVVKAIKDHPLVNISVDGHNIIKKKNINIGMATALPSGNLIVPVIKNADRFNLTGLAKEVNELALKARTNKLSPDDIHGGTYTVTNVGTFGNVMGTPIINQPQCAILALGAIRKKPAVIETEQGDYIGIRHMMFLSHAYDHRVIDGALGGSFVRTVADYLEAFDPNREL
ncbi:MAG: 2-oxo acid dehydrogenase subunit E2 [Flavobacteriales bacterium]|nr:2-oxo acid dehydrogenase subunit E2 [Flavobacteriales bacterium]